MDNYRRFSVRFFGWWLFTAAVAASAADQVPAGPDGCRIFVCGHSFHVIIAEPLAELGKEAHLSGHELLGKQFIGGSRVLQHWNMADDRNQAKKLLNTGKVDVLTLSPMPTLPDEGIDKFTELALEKNPKARILVQASWFPFDKPDAGFFFKNADRDNAKLDELKECCQPFYDKIVKQIDALNDKYKAQTGRQVVYLVPVGQAVLYLREKVLAGQVPGITKQSELFNDSIGHGKPPIVTLAAYCTYSVIYGRNPSGLAAPSSLKKEKEPDALNKILQDVSWQAVTGEPLSGVKK